MQTIKVMVNGIPGNMATGVARHVMQRSGFELVPFSLTGPEIQTDRARVEDAAIRLVRPEERDQLLAEIKAAHPSFLSVDYTHPSVVNENGEFYCQQELPFVMGTTGGNRQQLEQCVRSSSIAAVIAPNMAKQIVGFQAMMEFAADSFPDLFKGYRLRIKESHQKGKADTSGTAKAMVRYFNSLGVSFSEADIEKERNPETQQKDWGIPRQYLEGHGWHIYSLDSADGTVRFEFSHRVNGRDIYASGTLDALIFLNEKVRRGSSGHVYSMIDVLKNN